MESNLCALPITSEKEITQCSASTTTTRRWQQCHVTFATKSKDCGWVTLWPQQVTRVCIWKAGEKWWRIGYGNGVKRITWVQSTVPLVVNPGWMVCVRCGCVCTASTDAFESEVWTQEIETQRYDVRTFAHNKQHALKNALHMFLKSSYVTSALRFKRPRRKRERENERRHERESWNESPQDVAFSACRSFENLSN